MVGGLDKVSVTLNGTCIRKNRPNWRLIHGIVENLSSGELCDSPGLVVRNR